MLDSLQRRGWSSDKKRNIAYYVVKYYRQKLHFMIPQKLGAIKPVYDKNCVLMCKKLFTNAAGPAGKRGKLEYDPDFLGLADHRKKYFENFNNPSFH